MRVLAICGFLLLSALPAAAQDAPAEPPPEGFGGREYVDSRGCVFQRAGVSGTVIWVPRVDVRNNPVCGLTPSVAPAATPAAPAPRTRAAAPKVAARPAPPPALLVEDERLAARQSLCPSDHGKVQRLWVSDGRRVTNCGARAVDGVAFVNELGVPGLALTGTDPGGAARALALGVNGYRVTWSNGPLRDGVAPAVPGTGRWLQIGAFANPANADRAVAGLGALSLPAARQALNGGRLTAVLAGPFVTDAAARAALAKTRAAGYADAFLR